MYKHEFDDIDNLVDIEIVIDTDDDYTFVIDSYPRFRVYSSKKEINKKFKTLIEDDVCNIIKSKTLKEFTLLIKGTEWYQ